MRIRDARATDVAALAPLWRDFESEIPEPPWLDVDLDDELRDLAETLDSGTTVAVVAENETGELAGFAIARRRGRRLGRITDLYVIPTARGHGLASRLTASLVERLRDLGLDTVQLEVVATNHDARAIYARWGFKEQELTLVTPLDALARQLEPKEPTLQARSADAQGDERSDATTTSNRLDSSMNRIAIAVFDGAEELDFVGPWEVLSSWHYLYPDEVDVCTVGETAEPITCAKGMRVLPQRTWDDLGDIDVLVYPGGQGTRAQLGDERIRSRLRALSEAGTLLASVCTGALVFADAGLLDGLPVATYWSAFDELLPLGRDLEPRPDDRFVDNGAIVTAAGVSAGIDMALHLVGRLGSPLRAREVRRYIQYDPEPPY